MLSLLSLLGMKTMYDIFQQTRITKFRNIGFFIFFCLVSFLCVTGHYKGDIQYYLCYNSESKNIVTDWLTAKQYIGAYGSAMDNTPGEVSFKNKTLALNNEYAPQSLESAAEHIETCNNILSSSLKARRDMSEYLKTHVDNPELKELKAELSNSDSTIN